MNCPDCVPRNQHDAIVAELEQRISELQSLAMQDGLTGLGNQRSFDEALRMATSRADRFGFSVCLVLIDLGGLKQLNDNHGQDFGDRVLQSFASVLVKASRGNDPKHRLVNGQPMRQGGDEFALILEACDCSGGQVVIKRIRKLIESLDLVSPSGDQIQLAAYFAVVCCKGDSLSPTQIYHEASLALIQAKARKLEDRFPVVIG